MKLGFKILELVIMNFTINKNTFILEKCKKTVVEGQLVPDYPRKLVILKILQAIILRPGKLTGNEVFFIRKEFGLSKVKLGQMFGTSHTAVAKWEASKNQASCMDLLKDKELRLSIFKYIAKEVKLSQRQIESEFFNLYQNIPKIQKKKSSPIKVIME
jgi:transcriptional regulator with XRE-family HTH domain